ncbi:MAG TPA: sugar phosphate isomerase/epimerase family protein [Acidobacteriaceae bacterium]|nr:sugar phosphate isomerase/epimerase family protein [Acidobacteriaceae bacterium]
MRRRSFLQIAMGTAVLHSGAFAGVLPGGPVASWNASFASTQTQNGLPPMAIGMVIEPAPDPEAAIARVKQLGLTNCFLSMDAYIGKFSRELAQQLTGLLAKYDVVATTVEVVGPGKLVWNFLEGPSTIGLVPRATRAARIDALKQASDFAKMLGVSQVQTHCGFIPENPKDPLYPEVVEAVREVAAHCRTNGQAFLMETGQETPTTLSRTIMDVHQPNLGVGLDTANLILYGKANPVDAVGILGPHVRSVHAKDGRWPTNPMDLGQEVPIGQGCVDFQKVFSGLRKYGYTGAISIEREISGPQQIADVKNEKVYLERILADMQTQAN